MRPTSPCAASAGVRKMASRKPKTSTAMEMANQSQATLRRVWLRCSMRLVYREKRLFGVKHGLKEKDADGGEDDVVAGQLFDPGRDLDGIEIRGEDAGGGLDHRQKGGQGDGE